VFSDFRSEADWIYKVNSACFKADALIEHSMLSDQLASQGEIVGRDNPRNKNQV